MPLKLGLLLFIVMGCAQFAQAKETIVVYSRNYDDAFLRKSIENFAELSKDDFGDYKIVQSPDMEQGRAFAELLKGNIDLLVTAPTLQREEQANAIYMPIDRGLLGFRVCMVNSDSPKFSAIHSANDFIQRKLSIGVGTHWPDRKVFETSGFNVVSSPIHSSLYNMLKKKRFDCLTRSIKEITSEAEHYKEQGLAADQELVFIYPNADFMFINHKNKHLYERISSGVQRAIDNRTFYDTYDEFYKNELQKHKIYSRKLVFLNNHNISGTALAAINRFGIASFVADPVRSELNSNKSNSD